MPINATCQQCGATLPVPEEFAGKSVRCGGCQGIVRVPSPTATLPEAALPAPPAAPAVPVAKSLRPRPVAIPVAAKERPTAKAEVPIPKARKALDEDDDAADEVPKARSAARQRPIAKRRRVSVLTPTAFKWLSLFLMTGTVGLGVLAYAAWGASRKNDGTAYVPPDENQAPPQLQQAQPPRAPLGLDPPPDGRVGVEQPPPMDRVNRIVPPPPDIRPQAAVPPQVFDLPFKAGTNAVLIAQADRYTLSASSEFDANQWTVSKAFDNNSGSSWYSRGEGAGATPWVQVTFQNPVPVKRVVVLGNRDQYGNAYTVHSGTLTLLDGNDRVLVKMTSKGTGPKFDFDFNVAHPRVQAVRFTANTSANAGMCVAIGELQVE